MSPIPIEIIGAVLFCIAVIHTFSTKFFEHLAHTRPAHAGVWHLLGEVEVVFGFWAMVLVVAMMIIDGKQAAIAARDARATARTTHKGQAPSNACTKHPSTQAASTVVAAPPPVAPPPAPCADNTPPSNTNHTIAPEPPGVSGAQRDEPPEALLPQVVAPRPAFQTVQRLDRVLAAQGAFAWRFPAQGRRGKFRKAIHRAALPPGASLRVFHVQADVRPGREPEELDDPLPRKSRRLAECDRRFDVRRRDGDLTLRERRPNLPAQAEREI